LEVAVLQVLLLVLISYLPLIGLVVVELFAGVIGRKSTLIITTGLMRLDVSLTKQQ